MFKAAVIAVPIVGGLILIVLILLAVRMLREDYNRRYDSHGRLEKAQNFIQQHFNRKDRKTAALQKVKDSTNPKSSSEKATSAPVRSKHRRTEHWVEAENPLLKKSQVYGNTTTKIQSRTEDQTLTPLTNV